MLNHESCIYIKPALFGFADSQDPVFDFLRNEYSETHLKPEDIISDARGIISIFIPFKDYVIDGNVQGEFCSKDWALSFFKTGEMVGEMGESFHEFFTNELSNEFGYELDCSVFPFTVNYDEELLICDWSNKFTAYAAGLGTFGENNMLITEQGVVGRMYSIITNAEDLLPSEEERKKIHEVRNSEWCKYKDSGDCLMCVKRCVADAYTIEDDGNVLHDARKCADRCLLNKSMRDDIYNDYCGKCIVATPCSKKKPI